MVIYYGRIRNKSPNKQIQDMIHLHEHVENPRSWFKKTFFPQTLEVTFRKPLRSEKKGPWLFRVYKGLYYPVI